jgi:hypothetical protein
LPQGSDAPSVQRLAALSALAMTRSKLLIAVAERGPIPALGKRL